MLGFIHVKLSGIQVSREVRNREIKQSLQRIPLSREIQPTVSGQQVMKTHSMTLGYLAWLFGIFGAHRFYYGKPISGVLYLFTLGLLGIGWIFDLFLIPTMDDEARAQFRAGEIEYSVAWLLFAFVGVFGVHRFYMGDILWGILFLVTGGFFGLGMIYDVFTLNDQISRRNWLAQPRYVVAHY